jgi:cbb3-type cytochrome oxidase maturation protein
MSSLYLLIPISLIFLAVAILLFFWAVKNNQFDDFQGPAKRIVLDDQLEKNKAEIARRIEKNKSSEKTTSTNIKKIDA